MCTSTIYYMPVVGFFFLFACHGLSPGLARYLACISPSSSRWLSFRSPRHCLYTIFCRYMQYHIVPLLPKCPCFYVTRERMSKPESDRERMTEEPNTFKINFCLWGELGHVLFVYARVCICVCVLFYYIIVWYRIVIHFSRFHTNHIVGAMTYTVKINRARNHFILFNFIRLCMVFVCCWVPVRFVRLFDRSYSVLCAASSVCECGIEEKMIKIIFFSFFIFFSK